jgi:hypothetical protein
MGSAFILICRPRLLTTSLILEILLLHERNINLLMECAKSNRDVLFPGTSLISDVT